MTPPSGHVLLHSGFTRKSSGMPDKPPTLAGVSRMTPSPGTVGTRCKGAEAVAAVRIRARQWSRLRWWIKGCPCRRRDQSGGSHLVHAEGPGPGLDVGNGAFEKVGGLCASMGTTAQERPSSGDQVVDSYALLAQREAADTQPGTSALGVVASRKVYPVVRSHVHARCPGPIGDEVVPVAGRWFN